MTGLSIFLLSYNKGPYVLDAIRSVLAQTRDDWEIWLLENSNDNGATRECIELSGILGDSRIHYEKIDDVENIRARRYIPCWLLNRYVPEGNGEYIYIMSDDDLIDPECFELMAGHMDEHQDRDCVYAALRLAYGCVPGDVGPFDDAGLDAASIRMHPEAVDCRLDGAQVMFRRSLLNRMPYPWWEEGAHPELARHADGVFLQRMLGHAHFWPVSKFLLTHRFTALSHWTKG